MAQSTHAAYGIAWLDPLWRSGLATPTLGVPSPKGWLWLDALVIVEAAHAEQPDLLGLIDRRRYGRTALAFLRFSPVGPG